MGEPLHASIAGGGSEAEPAGGRGHGTPGKPHTLRPSDPLPARFGPNTLPKRTSHDIRCPRDRVCRSPNQGAIGRAFESSIDLSGAHVKCSRSTTRAMLVATATAA